MFFKRSAAGLTLYSDVMLAIKSSCEHGGRRWSILGFMPLSGNIVLILSDSGLLSLQCTIHTRTRIGQK